MSVSESINVKTCDFYTTGHETERCSTCGVERSIYGRPTPCPLEHAEQTKRSLSLVKTSPQAVEPPKVVRLNTSASWLVQMQDGRILRVDGDTLDATNGILVFRAGIHNHAVAVFGYGDWKRVGILDRETDENAGWTVVREKPVR